MHARISRMRKTEVFLALLCAAALPVAARNSEILGEVRFQPENGAAKTAGVWVDGKYVGYLNELKGSKKLLLLPGEHEISVREAGYLSVEQKISVEPNAVQTLRVSLAKIWRRGPGHAAQPRQTPHQDHLAGLPVVRHGNRSARESEI